jgi:F420-0:gamma-glutamyl ligase-like protein
MVSPRGHMEVRGELQDEKQFDPKLLLVTLAIAWSQECTAQGHIKRGLIRKRVDSQNSDIS